MSKLWLKLTGLAVMVFTLMPVGVSAASGGNVDTIVLVADSRRYSGWEAWFTNLYNESNLYFTLVTVITIPSLALLLGTLTGTVMEKIGIDLKSRVLAEH